MKEGCLLTASDQALEPADVGGLLADAASSMADHGDTGDTVLSAAVPPWPAQLEHRLSELISPPEPEIGYRLVPGLFAGFGDLGPTMTHWKDVDRGRTAAFDIGLVLVASLLGQVFGWENQQQGRIVHNILPNPDSAELQVGASSTARLSWHTEDAFHPGRADFLLLACVRNHDGVGTGLSAIGSAELSEADVAVLSEPQLMIYPDASYEEYEADACQVAGMPTLWRRSGRLCLRYDPAYTRLLTTDLNFTGAYHRLGQGLEHKGVMIALEPGDLLIVDNDATVHSRAPFRARYDGTDRWLKRVLVRAPRQRPASERLEHGYRQFQVRPQRSADSQEETGRLGSGPPIGGAPAWA